VRCPFRETDADWLRLTVVRVGNSTARSMLGGLGRSLDQAGWLRMVVSVALFRQKLLDGLPIILCKPRVCDQFNNLHEGSVPVLSAYTPHSNFEDFWCSQFVLGVLPGLARHEDSWAANHASCVIKNHLHCLRSAARRNSSLDLLRL
jgi:hypothetical protein